jgi:DegV family protein with EDD domain
MDQIERYDIQMIPIRIHFGDQEYLDRVDLSPDRFFQLLRSSPYFPGTHQPYPGDFIQVYSELIQRKVDVIYSMHLSSGITTNAQSALAAVNIIRGADHIVKVIDSKTTSLGLGFLVLELAEKILDEKPLALIDAEMQKLIPRMNLLFSVDSLDFLHRGGRIGFAQNLIGTLTGQKPILKFSSESGLVEPFKTVRHFEHAVQEMLNQMKEFSRTHKFTRIGIIHTANREMAETFRKLVLKEFQTEKSVILQEASAALACHVGPGGLGVVYY